MRGMGLYRTILTLPWVIPQVIAVLVWRSDFNESVGFINQFINVTNQLVSFELNGKLIEPLTWLGFTTRSWFTDPSALFTAACIVNIWLGIPFMMINSLGALQSIPRSVYEAAEIDGASTLSRFRHITLPLLKPVLVPASLLGAIWTFNNLNVIYLMTDGGRYEGADILVTDLFKQSFTYYRYGFAAAYS
jgi:arabinogalactan oligomer/maltooligosaccharide transport system permease protein